MSIKVILATVIIMTSCGAPSTPSPNDSSPKSVKQAVDKLVQGMLQSDGTVLSALASDKLSYGHSSGKIESKTEFVETFTSGASVFEEIKIEDQHIDIEDNTAIVRHTLLAQTNDPGKGPAEIKLGILLVWIKASDDWKLLARQAFKLP